MGIKHFLLWLPMILIAFANATLRELIFIKHYTESTAHQLSTITLMILCSIYVWFIFPILNIHTAKQSFLIGLLWVTLTIAFEFSLGRLTNKTWDHLFHEYNILAGRIWLLFLLCLLLLPYLVYIVKEK